MTSIIGKLLLKFQHIKYGSDLIMNGIPIIYSRKGGKIRIGNHVTINSSFLSNLIGLFQRTIIVARDKEASVVIGDYVGLSGVTIYAGKSITIGANTNIGGNTKILGYDFHPANPDLRSGMSDNAIGKDDISIGSNCFIGCNCIILKGVHIGDDVTVGAGSVVCHDVPSRCIVAGNPAKIIGNY